ncbi:hypothetical protein ALC62_07137 [Cyphomyrmex costatus]|uniref:Nuclease HARBI1 n=1 Tax=Cyphomyrmex costatus TaxID=456900 RepID=A0A151IHZ9_9HYME|nr:hypothetical protein ALC62_07137 [Cyphomyrmex costatus]
MSTDDELCVVSSTIICSLLDIDGKDDGTSSSSNNNDEDSNDEENEMRILYTILMVNETRGETHPIEKLSDYVERVVPGYSKIIFKKHFRVFLETFQMTLRLLLSTLNATNACGRKQISPEKQLMITLWFMATPDSYRSVCVKFGVGKATALRAVRLMLFTV